MLELGALKGNKEGACVFVQLPTQWGCHVTLAGGPAPGPHCLQLRQNEDLAPA